MSRPRCRARTTFPWTSPWTATIRRPGISPVVVTIVASRPCRVNASIRGIVHSRWRPPGGRCPRRRRRPPTTPDESLLHRVLGFLAHRRPGVGQGPGLVTAHERFERRRSAIAARTDEVPLVSAHVLTTRRLADFFTLAAAVDGTTLADRRSASGSRDSRAWPPAGVRVDARCEVQADCDRFGARSAPGARPTLWPGRLPDAHSVSSGPPIWFGSQPSRA